MAIDQNQPPAPTAPGDPAGQPSAPQAPERLYAGKYKTVEEMERAYSEAQSALNRETEARQRLESSLMMGGTAPTAPAGQGFLSPQSWTPPQAPPSAGSYTPTNPYETDPNASEFISRAEAARIAEERAAAKVQEWAQTEQQHRAVTEKQQFYRDDFFRRFPDLRNDEDIVNGVTGTVLRSYKHLHPTVFEANIPIIMGEIATKTRERIAAIKAAGRAEHESAVAAQNAGQIPGAGGPIAPPPAAPREPTPEEIQAEMRSDHAQRYNASRAAPPR